MAPARLTPIGSPGCRRTRTRGFSSFAFRLAVLSGLLVALAGIPAAAANAVQPGSAEPPSTPLERVQAFVQPTVVYEQITWTALAYDATNQQYFTDQPFTASFQCTGFVVNPSGYVATAGHCVNYSDTVGVALARKVAQWAYEHDYYQARPSLDTILTFAKNWRLVGQSKTGQPDLSVNVAYGMTVSGEQTGKALPARVVGLRPQGEGDVAILKIDAKNLTVLPLSNNQDTRVGTQVVSVGYPRSVDLVTEQTFDPSFKEGSISAEKKTKGGLYPVYEVSSAVSGGMSGGPTASMGGQAIGVNSFGIEGETQQFNFVQSSQTLEELMRGEGVTNELGQVTDLYRAGLSAYFAGDRDAAILAFDRALEIVPSHEFAQKYRAKAKELPEQRKILGIPATTLLLVVAAIFVVAVIVSAVVALLIVRRRRRRATSRPPSPAMPPETPPPGEHEPAPEATPPPETSQVEAVAMPPGSAAVEHAPTDARPQEEGLPATGPEDERQQEDEQQEPSVGSPEPGEPAKHFCAHCGAAHTEQAHFCESCGARLS